MINPGYQSKVSMKKFKVDAGPVIYCPECKKPIMEGVVLVIFTRCKHCGKWIWLKKKS